MLQLIYSKRGEQMSPEYLAGFFDGEGCIDTQRMYCTTKRYERVFYVRPRLRVAQAISSRVVLDGLHQSFGGHLYFRVHSGKQQQDSVSWELLSEDDMRRILKLMLPHLIVKREQAILCLWWLDNAKGLQRHFCPGIEQARHMFADELSAMKRDPQRLSERAIQELKTVLMRQSELGGDAETGAETTLARAA